MCCQRWSSVEQQAKEAGLSWMLCLLLTRVGLLACSALGRIVCSPQSFSVPILLHPSAIRASPASPTRLSSPRLALTTTDVKKFSELLPNNPSKPHYYSTTTLLLPSSASLHRPTDPPTHPRPSISCLPAPRRPRTPPPPSRRPTAAPALVSPPLPPARHSGSPAPPRLPRRLVQRAPR